MQNKKLHLTDKERKLITDFRTLSDYEKKFVIMVIQNAVAASTRKIVQFPSWKSKIEQ